MSEERIITAATVTSGEKSDGKELPLLIETSKANGMKIDNVIADIDFRKQSILSKSTKNGTR